MIPFRLLPVVGIGALAVGVYTVASTLIEDSETEHYDETTQQQVQDKMKNLNDELARLTDIKMLNDRRESTNQVKTAKLSIDGTEINELIASIETELDRLVKLNTSMKNKNGGKKRKKTV